MRTLYHEFESLEHLLAHRMLPGGSQHPIRFVVFGGTGAVGGAAVMELCRLILMSTTTRERSLRGVIHATGMSDKEVVKFVSRLYLTLGEEYTIEKITPKRHYRVAGRIDLEFSLLQLEIPQDLPIHIAQARSEAGEGFDLETTLAEYFSAQQCPFLRFVEGLDDELLHAVVVAIPLPSVATYTLTAIDRLTQEYTLGHVVAQRIKTSYLRTFIRGLAIIQQRHARHVVMAHTTAVGGMYRVDGGRAEIRLGFAHSALGKKLVDKKYFADELTQLYIDHGFDVLVTAAAIGIDAVEFRCHLPSDRSIKASLQTRMSEVDHSPLPPADLDNPQILLYPFRAASFDLDEGGPDAETGEETVENSLSDNNLAPLENGSHDNNLAPAEGQPSPSEGSASGETDGPRHGTQPMAAAPPEAPKGPRPLHFGPGKELIVDAAIRSGENGLFSVANCVALYHVMKVSIPEELAMVLVRRAIFGPERRRDWFVEKISYYTETENALFALRLLDNYPQLVRAQHGPFALQAYQALGSATHQARLHELGLLMLLLRLRQLGSKLADYDEDQLTAALGDLDTFLWRETRKPCFEDLEGLDVATLADLFGQLCEVDSMEDMGQLMGDDPRLHGLREPGRERFLARLANRVTRYIQSITSLGLPIIYRHRDGSDRLLVGPYVAPLDQAVATTHDLVHAWHRTAAEYEVPASIVRDWTIANNGFIDLRPHALVSAATEPGPGMVERVRSFGRGDELSTWIEENLEAGDYFTACGLVALDLRLHRLFAKIRRRRIELGTRETWKHLFQVDDRGHHLITPGLVETVRMYNEGLGKITGTEALWPRWGY